MPNINKVVYGNQTLIDLTNSTLSSADQLAQGVTAYDRGGNLLTGTAPPPTTYTATVTGSGNQYDCYVQLDSTKYYSAGSFTFSAGDSLSIHVTGQRSGGTIIIDGETVESGGTVNHTMTLPTGDIEIELYYGSSGEIEITTSGSGTAAISVVDTTDSHGGTVRTITALDISDTTAVAGDVAQGKYFYTAQGVKTQGTASGGGSVTITDEANATGTTCVITTGSAPSEDIPLNTQLIDFTAVTSGYIVDGTTGQEVVSQWSSCSDFTLIDPAMTFDYIGYQWYDLVFYNASKAYISSITMYQDSGITVVNDYAHGTLTPSKIPSTAKYVRIDSYPTNPNSSQLSLIRTA